MPNVFSDFQYAGQQGGGSLDSGMGAPQIGGTGNSGALPSPTANPVVDQLIKQLTSVAQTQRKVILPQQLPPNHVQSGDVSGNFVNPSTLGGPAHNARVSMAQSIGRAAEQLINRHEDKESRDLAFKITTLETNINTLNDPNSTQQEKAVAMQQLNEMSKADLKKIGKALNIQFMGDDKRTGTEKNAAQMAQKISQQGGQGTQGQQQQGGGQQQQQQQQQGPQLNPIIQQIMKRLPSTVGMTPEAAAQAEATKAGLMPSASDILKYASDQQYYKVLENKLGVEQAEKFAKIAEDYQTKMSKVSADMEKAQTQKEIADARIAMQETHFAAMNAIQGSLLQLKQAQLDEAIRKDKSNEDLKADKDKIDRLGKTAKSINDQMSTLQKAKKEAQKIASTGWFGTGVGASQKQKDAAKDITTIDKQISDLQARQQQVTQKLDEYGSPSSTEVTNPELDATTQKLVNQYLKETPQQTGQRPTL